MGTLLFLFKLLVFISEKSSERKKFYIDDKWSIELPTDWDRTFSEVEIDNSTILENIFFQKNSYLNMKIYSLNILKDDNFKKVEADITDILEVFEKIMSKVENKKEYRIPNYKNSKIKCYEYTYYENNEKVYSISCGIMVAGYLLIVNLYSALREEVESAIKYIYSIEKVK